MTMLLGLAALSFSLFACDGDSSSGGDDNTELSSSSIEADDSSSSSEITLSSSSLKDISDPLSSSSLQENSSSSTENTSGSSSAVESSSSTVPESSSSGEEVSSSSVIEESSSSSLELSSSGKEPESSSSSVNNICGSQEYDPTTKFCVGNNVYDKCGGMEFNPAEERCSAGKVKKYGTFTDSRDGQIYKWVEIGAQTWMAENLNYTSASGSWCYDNLESYCNKYGHFYDWNTAMAACPAGWHLPNNEEWTTLVDFVGGENAAVVKLKAKTGWNVSGTTGTDDYGFSALPGGQYQNYNNIHGFYDAVMNANWWTATQYDSSSAYRRYLFTAADNVGESSRYKSYGFSVRCIKD
jgi:uncharacterized protein (TIGR02145 family)